jgi:hypothetical protein
MPDGMTARSRASSVSRRRMTEWRGPCWRSARELASAGQYPQALATLAEATRLDPANAALQELTRQIQDARTAHEVAERQARELAAKLAEADSRLAAGDLGKARKSAEAAAHLDAHAAAAILARIAEAEAKAAQEKAERQKAAEAARQAREREQKVVALLTKARKAKRAADALGFLEEAQRLDPQRPEIGTLMAQRQAEMAHPASSRARPADRATGVGVPDHQPGRPLSPALLGAIGAAVLLLVLGLWYALRDPAPRPVPNDSEVVDVDPPPPPPNRKDDPPVVQPSAVTIVTEPWTNVTLTPAAGGAAHTCTTPCQLQLPPGDYQLAFENGGLSQPATQPLSVPPGQPVDVHRTMPGFDVDSAVARIIGR